MTAFTKAFEEFVGFITTKISPEDIIAFKPSKRLQTRVEELIDKEKSHDISAAEKSELDYYMMLEHVMILAKAEARRLQHKA